MAAGHCPVQIVAVPSPSVYPSTQYYKSATPCSNYPFSFVQIFLFWQIVRQRYVEAVRHFVFVNSMAKLSDSTSITPQAVAGSFSEPFICCFLDLSIINQSAVPHSESIPRQNHFLYTLFFLS